MSNYFCEFDLYQTKFNWNFDPTNSTQFMQQKVKDLLIACYTSLFSAIGLVVFIFGAIAFAIFNITLASIFELIVQFNKKVKVMIELMQTYIQDIRSSLAIRLSKFKRIKHDVRLLWGKIFINN
jgi:hypothetical protein